MAPRCVRLWLWLLAACVLGGCHPRRLSLDVERVRNEAQARIERVFERPEVAQALEKMFEGALEHPAVAREGDQLLEALGEDHRLEEQGSRFMDELIEEPGVKRWMLRLARKNPRARDEQIAALVGEGLGRVVDGPEFDAALEKALDAALQRPGVTAAFQRLERQMKRTERVREFGRAAAGRYFDERVVGRRLEALNGGRWPDRARATELILERVVSEERLAQYYVRVAGLSAVSRALSQACEQLLRAPSFRRHVGDLVVNLLEDNRFRKAAISVVAVQLSPKPKSGALDAALHRLLVSNEVEVALANLVDQTLKDPALAPIGDGLIAAILADRQVEQTLASLLGAW
jgi:hypothetical protein